MALSSQSSRSGMSRSYRSSSSTRRRRPRRLRWVLLVLLLAAGAFYLFTGGDDEPGDDAEAPVADARETAGAEPTDDDDENASSDRKPMAATEQPSGRSEPGGALAQSVAPQRVRDMNPVSPIDSTATRSRQANSGAASSSQNQRRTSERNRSAQSGQNDRDSRSSSNTSASRSSSSGSSSTGSSSSTSRQRSASPTTGIESSEIRKGMEMIADGDVLEGRRVLSELLFDNRRRLSRSDARAIRETLASINDRLVFSPEVASGDSIAEQYEVQSGDLLSRIARRYKLTYQFLEQINGIDARRLQVGQSVKLIRGPFHARVSKREYRMDVFVRQSDGSPIYIRSFPVGLGEHDSTPEGLWVIEPNRKVVNPDWRNPRTGEYYKADDPDNPIGDYWLALEGIDENTANQRGYGIHGTTEPDSVGQSVSMGCIRLRDGDIDQVYYLFVEGESTIEVVR